MSDFFSGLLERAFERAPVLQRRRPSRFESAPAATGWNSTLQQSDAPAAAADGPAQAVSVSPMPRPPMPAPANPPAAGRPLASGAKHGEAESSRAVPALSSVQPPAPTEREARNAIRHDTVMPSPPATAANRAAAPVPGTIKIITEKIIEKQVAGIVAPARVQQQDERKPDTPRAFAPIVAPFPERLTNTAANKSEPSAKVEARRTPELRHDPVAAIAKPKGAVAPPSSMLLPQRRSLLSTHPSPPARPAPSPSPVQVTIGRIEIRANQTASAPSARNARPAAPRLSLDDYLRSRNGGDK